MSDLPVMLQEFFQISNIKELLFAFVIALPIGWNREKESRSMGLRTFPLVAVASCGYMLIGSSVVDGDPDALSKLLYGLMTGIGFIGGGAILKDGASVQGTATAASIWNTGAVGAAVAFHRYEIAVVLAVISFMILSLAKPIKNTLSD
ncbi:MgtC/SapB family protein [Cocleimonas sp. KMM 6892]|jgi:putative Mg2+ transporter-C (MgtC) family protein|uniref:MgtC/SapB family protein n=1 Tax=unclassified Cocleimonas TaxID=2639732 RepID=UPI002DB80247|nr:MULTISPECIES: MgtC/SapB family protein [unclassified Cocleimonas]MEB8433057.1 MgtC/SapB family protein [Cocleimonas sp. KMM 6892]MEC4715962.1 MgtC/SapB family protein [Cocleimonas sp. KMM 6895]MEC4745423.1 MgtC/SapB family protein [Cocleimonas sp. KMM 6896]